MTVKKKNEAKTKEKMCRILCMFVQSLSKYEYRVIEKQNEM